MIKLLSFSFRGRSDRLEYWRVQLVTVILSGVVGLASLVGIETIGSAGGLLFLGYLPLFALSIAVTIRRLHDRGKSGWWYALFVLAPLVLTDGYKELAEYNAPGDAWLSLTFSLGGLALGLWGLVEIGFLRGQPQSNRFGDYRGTGSSSYADLGSDPAIVPATASD